MGFNERTKLHYIWVWDCDILDPFSEEFFKVFITMLKYVLKGTHTSQDL